VTLLSSFFPFRAARARDEDPRAKERAVGPRPGLKEGTAFRELFEQHAGAVHGFLWDLLGDKHAADEGTQEVFLRALDRAGSLREPDKLRPWLLGIARNVSLEQLRTRKRHACAVIESQEDEDGALPVNSHPLPPTPETLLLDREAHHRMAKAVSLLSEDRRAVVLLRIEHALSYQEIAEILGWSLTKVKVELHRARLQLRADLASDEGESL